MIIIIFDLTSNPIRPDSNPTSEKTNILVYTSKEKTSKSCVFFAQKMPNIMEVRGLKLIGWVRSVSVFRV